ncbi:helix-turn-helix transcriptional regulator [Kineococcus rubinsiae]|uniref:helix-turn-helix transcriptional regulator n=1 Tax=Kineococcus rubinsiae TaxID=2609562 RepID=UPI0027E4A778|nr:YafY family protein [Kineococcus rubinsiae]
MPRPTARVLALLELLQSSSRTRTVGELADRLGVDERTVRRYVAHLGDLDVPVRSVRGPHGGIRLEPGYRMPPLMLTGEEALAVLLGLVAGRRAGVVAASAGVVDSAVAKVRRVLPVALQDRLDGLLATADAALPPARGGAAPTDVLLALADAVRERRAVDLTHTAADGRRTRRTVHPHGLVARSGHWYLSAGDPAGGDVRTFRVDRVDAAEVLASRFDPPPGVDAAEEVAAALARVPWRHGVSLRVRSPAEEAAALFPAGLVTVEPVPEHPGWVRVTFRAERLDWVPGLLAGLGVPVVVEGPEALRDLVRATAARLTAAAGG